MAATVSHDVARRPSKRSVFPVPEQAPLCRRALVLSLALALSASVAVTARLAACGGRSRTFIRGDADCNGTIELADAVRVLRALFSRGVSSTCLDAADANDDGRLNIGDAVEILLHLFGSARLDGESILWDPTADVLGCFGGHEPCPPLVSLSFLGTVREERIREPSGLAVGRRNPGVLWLVNDFDSGRDPGLYALAPDGRFLAEFVLCPENDPCPPSEPNGCPVGGTVHCDWEGLASGPGANGASTLFIGDIGNNRVENRTVLWIHRLLEPAVPAQAETRVLLASRRDFDTFYLAFAGDRAVDAEALACDPITGDLYLIGHEIDSDVHELFRFPAHAAPGETVTPQPIAVLPELDPAVTFVSGADFSPSGRLLALKLWERWELTTVLLYTRDGDDLATIVEAEPCRIILNEHFLVTFHAGAIALDGEDSFLSLEERPRTEIYRLGF